MAFAPVVFMAVALASSGVAPREHIQVPPQNVHSANTAVPQELREPLAAVSRIATGLQTDMQCKQLTADETTEVKGQLTAALATLTSRLGNAGISSTKARSILVNLMSEGENLARNNFPTCTNIAPQIIVKAKQDAACINPYLAGSNTMCFRN